MTDTAAPLVSSGSMLRDDNDQPIQGFGVTLSNSKTLTGSGATVAVPLFSVTGTVSVLALWGNVTTALGNCTATAWRLNDGSAQSDITLATGTSLTNATAGSIILRRLLATNALNFDNASQERVQDAGGTGVSNFSEFVAVQKTAGVATNIEFVYTTSDTPTTGVINFYIQYVPLGAGSKITTI